MFSEYISKLSDQAEEKSKTLFSSIDKTALYNTTKVQASFQKNKVALTHFSQTTGYGYDDIGRDNLDRVYADAFGCEDAIVRPNIVNGTHALYLMLRAVLPTAGGKMLSITGDPYDTLMDSIHSFEKSGLQFQSLPFSANTDQLYPKKVIDTVLSFKPDVVYIQRSKGYGDRITLSSSDIKKLTGLIKALDPSIVVACDNCYGEFVEADEPFGSFPEGFTGTRPCHIDLDAPEIPCDIAAGSLIKNPGGGLAPGGGYITGKHEWVDRAAQAMTVPGLGREVGSNPQGWRLYYQGFFMAPHIVAQALKTAVFSANLLEGLGYKASPAGNEFRSDIIQTILFGSPEPLISFCRGIQEASPVDSFLLCEPWDMPGYHDPVIMAAGAFVQGASIELSADAPLREPYLLYMQGSLTYESGKLSILRAVNSMLSKEDHSI